jgi:RNA polymerase sigma-70 factor (ECF subfamily)
VEPTRTKKAAVLRVVANPELGAGRPSFEEIYRRFSRYVAAIVLRLDPRVPDLEDIVQDVFLEAARGLGRLRDPNATKAWLATVSVRLVRRQLRARRMWRWLGWRDDGHGPPPPIDVGTSPMDRLLLAAVYQVLDEIAVGDRLAFVLHHVEGERLEVVASMCGCSLATIKRRIQRAQRAIELRVDGDGNEAPR